MKWFGLFCLSIAAIWMVGCNNANDSKESAGIDTIAPKDTIVKQKTTDSLADEETLTTIATEILTALKAKDYKAFTAYFHPTDSVLFSPYGFIDIKTSKKLTKATFTKLIDERGSVNWGYYDGTGKAIRLSAQQYLDKFVYNADYLNAEKTAFNQVIGKGNSLNNLKEVYPRHPFIEYYFSGFNQKYEGMDWTSLRLVFSAYEGNYYLVAVVHDQWTS